MSSERINKSHSLNMMTQRQQQQENHKYNTVASMKILSFKLSSLLLLPILCNLSCLVEAQYGSPSIDLTNERLDKPPEEIEGSRERLTILAPRRLRPQSDYHILVSLAKSPVPATIDLTMTGGRDSNQEYTDAKSVLAQSGETQTVKFRIGDWLPAEYVLNVSAQAVDRSWNFTSEVELQYQAKKFSILLQTDKAIYKPGEEVKFRAIFLDPQLNPINLRQEINVTITDPRRNIVKQWLSESNEHGLISLSLPLSQDPMMGEDWTIRAEARGQVGVKTFEVAEYILPTFDVHIDLPPFATYNESDIVASVRAVYTYGKPVDGHVTLTVQPKIRYQYLQTRPLDSQQFRVDLNPKTGKADIQLDIMKDLWLEREHYEREIEFFALVEEKLTGRKYNKTETMFIYEKPIRIDLLNEERTFKPGMPHLFQFRVAYQDQKPVEDNGPEMVVRFIEDQQLVNITRLRPIGGLADYWLDIPRYVKRASPIESTNEESSANQQQQNSWLPMQYLDVQVMYRNQIFNVGQVSSQRTKSGEHLSVTVGHLNPLRSQQSSSNSRFTNQQQRPPRRALSPVISVGEDLQVQVRSTEPMPLLTCQGIARGDIVWAVTKQPAAANTTESATYHEFSVKLDQRMTPRMRVLCFYVRDETREIIVDGLSFPVNGLFRNQLKLSLSTDEARPGQQVEIRALTKPNSLVGLLAVDQSVLLLKTGNDLSQEDLKHETESYGARFADESSFWGQATSADRIFQEADVIVLTNNKIFNGWEFRQSNSGEYPVPLSARGMETASDYQNQPQQNIRLENSRLVLSAPMRSADLLNLEKSKSTDPIVIRSQFPETWLWENSTTDSSGQTTFSARVPDTITSWHLSGFSLNDEHGFGLSSGKTSLRVFRPFFIRLNLPHSIIRGETINIQAIVNNFGKRPTQARVTFHNHLDEFDFVEASNEIDDEFVGGNQDDDVATVDGASNAKQQQARNQTSQSRLIRLEPEQGVSVSFLVRPKRLGHLDVRVVARAETGASDGLVKKLLVKPEGQTQFMNKAMLINLPGPQSTIRHNFSIETPPNAVPGSQKVFVSAIGDVMGAGLANVDDLLRLPYGCGEQNMINLVPNIVILNYLMSSRRLKEAQRLHALRNIETGYQRQLNYKRRDGSFSAFGDADKNGSVWLTAYVLKTFQQARSLIQIDSRVIHQAANYLAQFAQSDGSIREFGMIHDKRLQSSSSGSSSLYLTAYSMISLLQGPLTSSNDAELGGAHHQKAIDEVIQKGIDYLAMQIESRASSLSTYEIAIVSYALQLAGRQNAADRAYQLLWAEARQDEAGGTFWSNVNQASTSTSNKPSTSTSGLESEKLLASDSSSATSTSTVQPPLKPIVVNTKHSAHLFLPDSLSIEMTSLALLPTIRRGELDRALPIVKWLIGKQNSNGGFSSTQDTVLAIEALAAFASAASASKAPTSIDIELIYPRVSLTTGGGGGASGARLTTANQTSRTPSIRRNNVEQMLITSTNELVYQQLRLSSQTTGNALQDDTKIPWVALQATGSGSGVVQVSWQYNLLVSAERPAFYLNPYVDHASNINYLQLSVCTYYKMGESSNMAVIDVELPSGYVADLDALPSLKRTREVKRIDTSDGDTRVLIYLDRVTSDELCLTVPAHRTAKVSNNKPVPVTIYDYYDRHQAARIFYEPIMANSCDICDSDSCSKACAATSGGGGGAGVGKRTTSDINNNNYSDRRSLHDQRKLASPSTPSGAGGVGAKTNDKLQAANDSSTSKGNPNYLLPLAPVLMTLISLFQ